MQTPEKEEIKLAGTSENKSEKTKKEKKKDKKNKSNSPSKSAEIEDAKKIALAASVAKSFIKKANKK